MLEPATALAKLREGNQRFIDGKGQVPVASPTAGGAAQLEGQRPFAIVLGCSDSRVPAEIVFDQGLGDLFVIRVAGNIVAPSQIGSVEFAAAQFGTRVVVVMGHTHCGAIGAALAELRQPGELRSPNLKSIVERIVPGLEHLSEETDAPDMLNAVRANVARSVQQLQHGSEIIEEMVRDGQLVIVGAVYDLATGAVTFAET